VRIFEEEKKEKEDEEEKRSRRGTTLVRVYTWCNRETSSSSTGSHEDIKQCLT